MIWIGKTKDDKVDITMSELIEKYANRNYVSVDYRPNGVVNVWIAPLNRQEKKEEDQEE